jgi:hypothetical protein
VLDGLDEQLAKHDYNLAFTLTLREVRHSTRRSLISNERVDGIVLLGPVAPMPELIDLAHTIVVEGLDEMRWKSDLAVDIVTVEKRRAIYQVAAHLAALGRHRLGFLGPSRERRAGRGLSACSGPSRAPVHPALMQEAHGPSKARTGQLSPCWHGIPGRMPLSVRRCDRHGHHAGSPGGAPAAQDLAITGFDDVPSPPASIPLTTVSAPEDPGRGGRRQDHGSHQPARSSRHHPDRANDADRARLLWSATRYGVNSPVHERTLVSIWR